jgi:hypothetical protein
MHFETPDCPTCRKRAIGTLEMVQATAEVAFTNGNTAEYTGTTHYGESYSLGRGPHILELVCPDGHEWPSYLLTAEGNALP